MSATLRGGSRLLEVIVAAVASVGVAAFLTAQKRRRRPPPCSLLVKLGGSAVTVKSTFETLNGTALKKAADALARGQLQGTVLMHGAGSFGHFQAREHAVSRGPAHESFSWLGFAATRASVTTLNHHVVEALLNAGISAVGVSPFPRWTTHGKALANGTILIEEIADLLRVGLTPVLHGDAVLDSLQGASILSGDTIMERLATELRPRLVVFVTDVAGVHTRPPSEAGARLIERITVDAGGRIVAMEEAGGGSERGEGAGGGPSMTTAAHDVTGGIATKLGAARRIAAIGVRVVIVEVGTEHAEVALRGELPRVCTLLERV